MEEPLLTKKRSLTTAIEEKINAQIGLEAESSQVYLAMASWADKEGYENSAAYLYRQAEEEREHMLKLMGYVNEAGGHALAPEVTGIRNDFDELRHLFDEALEHEIKVSLAINDLAKSAFECNDFATFQFLQWFVNEQREEETNARRVIEIFDLIGEQDHGLWMIEQEIGRLSDAIRAEEA